MPYPIYERMLYSQLEMALEDGYNPFQDVLCEN